MQFSSQYEFITKSNQNSLFFTLGKGEGNKIKKVYKSETQKYNNGYKFNMTLSNTDSIADSNPGNEVTVTIYKYSKNGNHMKYAQ